MDVETKDASLSVMAVTIKALHVSGKQMTLAVFRQLPIAYGVAVNVELWGTVRYSIKDQGDIWFVLSHKGKLYRRGIADTPSEWRYKYGGRMLEDEITNFRNGTYRFVMSDKEDPRREEYLSKEKELQDALNQTKTEEEEQYRGALLCEEREEQLRKDLPQLFIAV